MRRVLAVVLLLSLAGCLSGGNGGHDGDPPVTTPAPLENALAAYDAGNLTSNIHRWGQVFGSGAAEIDAWGDFLFIDSANVVHIVDVSDPMEPVEVGRIDPPGSVEDVKVSDDGNWLFIGDDAEAGVAPAAGTASNGGFYVYDISNKTAPVFSSYFPVGPRRGPHMVYYHETVDGDELVFGANADVSINRFDRATGELTELARYQADLVTAFNRDPQVFDVLYQGWAHDMFVMEDPVENRTLMYVANWDAGVRIVDLSDPANPVEVGGWNDFPEGHEGNLHTVATEWIGDRRITVGAVEVGFSVVGGYHYAMGTDRSIVYVWDTTDAANIELLGTWENPDGTPSGRDTLPPAAGGAPISSTHNLQLEQGRIYLAHYAFGVWVLDVSTPETQTGPQILGFHFEEGDSVWDVVLNNGVVYSSGSVGVIALHYAPDIVGPDGIDSRA